MVVPALLLGVWLAPSPSAARPPDPGTLRLHRVAPERPVGPVESVANGRDATLVAVFASWCVACATEVPMLNRLAAELGPRGVRVVAVSSERASPRVVARWLGRHRVAYPAFFGDDAVVSGRSRLGRLEILPTLILLSRRGSVLRRWTGAVEERTLRAALAPLLRPPASTPPPKRTQNQPKRTQNQPKRTQNQPKRTKKR